MTRSRKRIAAIVITIILWLGAVTLWKMSSYHLGETGPSVSQHGNQGPQLNPSGQTILQTSLHDLPAMGEMERHESRVLTYDMWSTDGAMAQLERYNMNLNNNKKPITVDPANVSTVTEWWQAAAMFAWYIRSPLRYKCQKNLTSFGGWAICQDEPYTVKAPCLVYSFGIAYDFSFDDEIGKKLGCDVRSFDPSMLNVTEHRRSQNVQFYRYGLGDRNNNAFKPDFDEYVKSQQAWKIRTLRNLVRGNGHEGMTIDVLKIDIESTEWDVLDNLIDTDMLQYIRHLLIEYHFFPTRPPKENYVHYFQVLTRLRQMGFREYYNLPHSEFLLPNAYRHQGETFYINANFRPSHERTK